jgi:hypothetical protein
MVIIITPHRQLWADCPETVGASTSHNTIGLQQGGADVARDTGFHVCGLLQPSGLRWRYSYSPNHREVEVNLRPTVSRPVCLGVRHSSGTGAQFFFLLEISFRQLRVCYFVAPSLTRRRVYNLLYNCFWALPEQSFLGRSPAELTAIFYYLLCDSPTLVGQVPVFLSPRYSVAQLYPLALSFLFIASYDSQGYGGGILTRHY